MKISNFYTAVVLVSHLLAFSVVAQTNDEQAMLDCENPSGSYEENFCLEIQLNTLDERIEQTFQAKLDLLAQQPYRQEQFKLSQTTWQEFRKAHCQFDTSLEFGTGLAGSIMQCNIAMATQRLEYLQAVSDE